MKNIGIDCRSGIATAAVSLPVFLIGYCLLLFFESHSVTTLFFALVIIACVATITLGLLQGVWTKKTYVHRLHKTTLALEEFSLGKPPEQLIRERYVLCSDIKQCPEDHSINDCLNCELYAAQNDIEKIGVIVRTLGYNFEKQNQHTNNSPRKRQPEVIDLTQYRGHIRCDSGYVRPQK
jgi:hypothetical protein